MVTANAPYTYQLVENLTIDEKKEYRLTFTATKDDPTNWFRICCSQDIATLYIDNLRVIDRSATSVRSKKVNYSDPVISEFELQHAYPNPFNSSTTIRYRLSQPADIFLAVYNLTGHKVRTLVNGSRSAGFHNERWNGADDAGHALPSGVYFYRLQVRGECVDLGRKLVLVK